MKKDEVHLSWTQLDTLINRLAAKLRRRKFDLWLIISRGGLVPGGILAKRLDFFNIVVASIMWYDKHDRKMDHPVILEFPDEMVLHGRRVLIIDEVSDSGDTIKLVRKKCQRAGARVQVATIHYKPGTPKKRHRRPDFFVEETRQWIHYPWEPEDERES